MNKKNIMIFFTGLLIGGTAGVLGSRSYFKKKYEEQAEKEIEQVRQYYFERERYLEKAKREIENEENDQDVDDDSREKGVLSPEKRAEIKEKLRKNREWAEKQTTNYSKIYADKHNIEEEDDEVDERELINEDEKEFERHQEEKSKKPEIISLETAGNLPPSVESKTLFFYTYDETLTDEEDEVIDLPEVILGKHIWDEICTNLENLIDLEESETIFVMNHFIDTCYEIQIIEGSFNVKEMMEDE